MSIKIVPSQLIRALGTACHIAGLPHDPRSIPDEASIEDAVEVLDALLDAVQGATPARPRIPGVLEAISGDVDLSRQLNRAAYLAVRDSAIADLAREGYTDPQIAEELGLTTAGVRSARRKAGIPRGRRVGSGWERKLRAAHAGSGSSGLLTLPIPRSGRSWRRPSCLGTPYSATCRSSAFGPSTTEDPMLSERVKDRIAKLLAIAGEEPRNHEARIAWDHAMRLCELYAVSVEDVRLMAAERQADPGVVRVWHQLSSRAVWRATLAWAIEDFAHVKIIRYGDKLSIIGTPADIDRWRSLFERAEREIDEEARSYVRSAVWQRSSKSEGDTFRKGAAWGFRERLETYKAEAEASVNGQTTLRLLAEASGGRESTALVLISRALAVQQKKEEIHPNTSAQRVTIRGSRDAFRDGHAFGKQIGVHRGEIE